MRPPILAVAACASCLLPTVAAGQNGAITMPAAVERGPSLGGVGARLSILFLGGENLSSGIEFGYASLSGSDQGLRPDIAGSSIVEVKEPSGKMWHATLTTRREWIQDRSVGLYAGVGTGVYYLSQRREYWQTNEADPARLDFRSVPGGSWQLGINLGGGVQLQPLGHVGAFDLDARWHLLPFAGSLGFQSVFTVSAGISIF